MRLLTHEAIREGSQAWQKARQGSRQALECRGATSVESASRPTTSEASVDRGLVSLLGMSHRTGLAVGLGPGGRCSHPGSDWNPYRFVRLICLERRHRRERVSLSRRFGEARRTSEAGAMDRSGTLAPAAEERLLPPPLLLPLFPVQCAPLPAATPPSAASRAPPRPGYGHRRQGPSATYRHGQGAPPHRPYGQSGGPGAKHSAYALSDTSGRVSLHRLARASPAGTP